MNEANQPLLDMFNAGLADIKANAELMMRSLQNILERANKNNRIV